MTTELIYDEYVVVAQDEWTLECLEKDGNSKSSHHLGGFEWTFTFVQQYILTVECKQLKEGSFSGEIHLELFIYQYAYPNIKKDGPYILWKYTWDYEPGNHLNPTRVVLNRQSSNWSYNYSCSNCIDRSGFVALNVRILKDRPLFHDFTVDKPIGHASNDLTLKVGEKTFHVNKKMLEFLSAYFYRMFNNANFVEAKMDEINTGETDEALFHDFLLIITPNTNVLPNSKNLAALMRLAHYYGVDSLTDKFELALKFCRELPITERIVLAKKYGGSRINVGGILHGVNDLDECKRVCVALFHAED